MANLVKLVKNSLTFVTNLLYYRSMKQIYSVNEAARLMGISEPRVRVLLAQGRIQGFKMGGTWIVTKLGYKVKKRGFPKGGKK